MLVQTVKVSGGKLRAYFPEASEVYLLGQFNNWSTTATPLVARENGHWETEQTMTPDQKTICFFVWERGRRFGRLMAQPS